MRTEFDYGNARDNVPSSFLQSDEPHEAVAPTCRGYWSNGVLVPLSEADDTLAEANGVPRGVHWEDHHAWEGERQTYLRGIRVRLVDPDRAAEMLATLNKMHVHWEPERQTFVTWPLRDWERTGEMLERWAKEFERETHVNGTD